MEPQLPIPRPSPEAGDLSRPEKSSSDTLKPSPVELAGRSVESPRDTDSKETIVNAGTSTADGAAFTAGSPPLPTLPPAIRPVNDSPGSADTTSINPPVAADEDLIEKEWVVRAKKIVATTKDDPYHQEREVSKLQVDYLKKRFNKDIKIPAD
ncbi:MAG: hypothetical protein EOT04_01610 [Candidatus Chaera renei]|uniref:Uncharacterized protein n=1 Tax=Candidatus Chaera renei TaxID=2506947 RepID=A0A4Q0AIU0_9BACT|nr:MAG: hypothetical protein EOT04_01610 [Candidatus Chaera renei]